MGSRRTEPHHAATVEPGLIRRNGRTSRNQPVGVWREVSEMSEISSKSARNQDVKTYEVNGIQVYGRKGPEGEFTELDAIDGNEKKIREIADVLQRRGYGVMRQRQARAGRVYELFKATWIGNGPAP